jgi:homocysteine S-methyltransferase
MSDILRGDRILVLDGGLATQMEANGNDLTTSLWSASLLQANSVEIVRSHRQFLEAGAQILISASYQGSVEGFQRELKCSQEEAVDLLQKSVRLAEQAKLEYLVTAAADAVNRDIVIAASCGPYAAVLSDGSEYTGDYSALGTSSEQISDVLEKFHRRRLAILDDSKADLIAMETLPSFLEAQVLRKLSDQLQTPFWVSFCCKDGKRLADGTLLRDAITLFANSEQCLAVGVNCVKPQHVSQLISEIKQGLGPVQKRIVVYANAGEIWDNATHSWSTPTEQERQQCSVAENAPAWIQQGASIIGGCCRVLHEDIAKLAQVIQTTKN